ncbi:MAG TPA: pseudouridine synthase [Bacteroidia bacterium]|nr:pseudouridine synthase [Bacteroidia bacterium]
MKNFGGRRRNFSGDSKSGKRSGGKKPSGKRTFGKTAEGGSKKYSGERGSNPFGDRKKSFGDRDDSRPRRKFDDSKPSRPFGDRKRSFGDRDDSRPRRKFDDSKPSRPFGDRKKSFGDRDDSRPRRKFDDSKPSRPFGDRKKSFGDRDDSRPRRKFDDSKSSRPFGDRKKSFGDRDDSRPRRKFDDSKPSRPFGDRKKSFGDREDSRPRRKFDDSKPSRPFGDRKKSFGDRDDSRPRRKFNDEKPHKEFIERKKPSEEKGNDEWQVFDNKDEANDFREESQGRPKKSRQRPPRKFAPTPAGENEVIRLNRFIANTGLCSRREADELIEAGVIKVNGKIVTTLGTKIGPADTVHYGDQLLKKEMLVYILLNKPKDYITTTEDPQERKTVMHLVEGATPERVYPVGRLDRNTTGLLLLTNDGDLAERLMHPKYGIRKIYHVTLDKNLRKEDFEAFENGVELEDGFIKADELNFTEDGSNKKEVGIAIHSGRNRIVRRLFEHLGYSVISLDRVVYAGLNKKNLQRGKWRSLTPQEVGFLKMQVGGEKKKSFRK